MQLIHQNGERLFVTSLDISNRFGKQHKDVLRAIENLECSLEFRQRNFAQTVYHRPNPSGGNGIPAPMFEITRDGFVFLCMGFTGAQAARWKERYIAAFNAMEAALRQSRPSLALSAELDALRAEVLRANPLWARIARYRRLGLTLPEIGQLVGRNESTVRRELRRMEGCGVIAAPADLPRLRAAAQRLQKEAA